MDFRFDDQQVEFRTQLRAFTDKTCTPASLIRVLFFLVAEVLGQVLVDVCQRAGKINELWI